MDLWPGSVFQSSYVNNMHAGRATGILSLSLANVQTLRRTNFLDSPTERQITERHTIERQRRTKRWTTERQKCSMTNN
jgi:hypothetical protein